jgi:hypothetical protein
VARLHRAFLPRTIGNNQCNRKDARIHEKPPILNRVSGKIIEPGLSDAGVFPACQRGVYFRSMASQRSLRASRERTAASSADCHQAGSSPQRSSTNLSAIGPWSLSPSSMWIDEGFHLWNLAEATADGCAGRDEGDRNRLAGFPPCTMLARSPWLGRGFCFALRTWRRSSSGEIIRPSER